MKYVKEAVSRIANPSFGVSALKLKNEPKGEVLETTSIYCASSESSSSEI
jgi:hypothetical protein